MSSEERASKREREIVVMTLRDDDGNQIKRKEPFMVFLPLSLASLSLVLGPAYMVNLFCALYDEKF
jgi:hypothetical protein